MKWKCKSTGNVIELPDYETETMMGHDGYEAVVEEPVEPAKKTPAKKTVKDIDNDTDSI